MSKQRKIMENIELIKKLPTEDLARIMKMGAEIETLIKKNTPALLKLNKCKVKHCNTTKKNKMKQCLKKHCKSQTMKLKSLEKNMKKLIDKHFTKKEQKGFEHLVKNYYN
jgi:hypothetical protein